MRFFIWRSEAFCQNAQSCNNVFLSCFWDYEISSFFELWTVKMWLQILTSANSSKKQGSVLKWDMCLFMGKGQKTFPPYFQDIFPSQDFKHCLFGFFSMVAGFHSGYWSAYVLLSRCRGCCAGRPCGSCRQMCLCCVLTHFLLSPAHLDYSVALASMGHLTVPNTPPSLPPTHPPPPPPPLPSHICWQKGAEAGHKILDHHFSSTPLL